MTGKKGIGANLKLPGNWPVLLAAAGLAGLLALLLLPHGEEESEFLDPVYNAEMAHSLLLAQIEAAEAELDLPPPDEPDSGLATAGAASGGFDIVLTRNLFEPADKGSPPKTRTQSEARPHSTLERHQITTIFIDGDCSQASFGGHHLVEVGDLLHEYTVVEITTTSVTLAKGSETFTLKMGAK
jgi:hypothetical protein